jgi:DNA-binding transcriptional ArsR family regulator
MGPAFWLYSRLVQRQTLEVGDVGYVLGGMPITYRQLSEDMGLPERTLRRWMKRLVDKGYVKVRRVAYSRMVIMVLRQKKRPAQQIPLPADGEEATRPKVADLPAPTRPEVADLPGQNWPTCAAKSGHLNKSEVFEGKEGSEAGAPEQGAIRAGPQEIPSLSSPERAKAEWDRARASIRASLNPHTYESWFPSSEGIGLDADGTVVVVVPSRIHVRRLQETFVDLIRAALGASFRCVLFAAAEASAKDAIGGQ